MSTLTPQTRQPRARGPLVLLGLLVASFAVAAIGGLATAGNVDGWYATADKPPFNPPNWLFAPVWTALYAAMAVAAWLVWRRGGDLRLWWVQLALNLAWTPVFFAAELLWPALVVIVLLDLAVAATLVMFWRTDRVAGALFVPYLAWVLFATALNASIAALN
ncbi:TspO/MBR family protein [Aeromicrobium stalagmiti]|uniref:TspO/MBR family protein n=1 Tax=Aeromicrobium stalagmiti TaxID=2738988 RepID=UPI0015696683|nr:TspO/MBR family protein [Aeromicrobium stalagmiti]NRQ48333.1 tryptophan-rich sensory protein [Aeromicrobium stalagmiti]